MKETTKVLLEKSIVDDKVKYKKYYDLSRKFDALYQEYLGSEVDSVEDLFGILPKSDAFTEKNLEYMNFIGQYFSKFKVSNKVIKGCMANDLSELMTTSLFYSIGRFAISDYRLNESKKFVNIVNGIVEEQMSLLDVGSGTPWPISSLQFLKKHKSVTTMDEFDANWDNFDLFEKLGLNVKNEYFTKSTKIKDYDAIVGSAPCSAIIPMVESCAKTKDKEYVINMCACCSPTGGMTGYIEYLKNKDKDLKCFVVKYNSELREREIIKVKDENLNIFDDVYITNSNKHDDDIMDVMYKNLCKENEPILEK